MTSLHIFNGGNGRLRASGGNVSARSLQDDLLSIPGVEGADVEGSEDRPAGLRIRIAEGADQGAVGGAIRRVLNAHGLGTDTRLPGEDDGADAAEDEPAEAAPMPAQDDGSMAIEAEAAAAEGLAAVAVLDETDADDQPLREDEPSIIDLTDRAAAPAPREPDVHGFPRFESVAVREGRDGISVVVSTSDGRTESQAAASSEGGVEAVVVRATAALARPGAPQARVVEIDDRRVEGVDIVLIVLELDGQLASGSSVVRAGRAYALGRATWAALTT